MAKQTKFKKESLSERLVHDENAWLKAIGELGDLCRMVLELRDKVATLEKEVQILKKK